MKRFTELDKAEAGRLKEAVRRLETATIPGDGSSSALLERFLTHARLRIAQLEESEEQAIAEERDRASRDIAHAAAVQREAALNAAEKRQYAEFLEQEYFTKAEFEKLEQFYEHSWERLSDDGKAQMSHRVWEGVRREEYKFSELPDIVKEKEAQQLHELLLVDRMPPELGKIPTRDRSDFTTAWDQGKKHAAYQVLDRESFSENVALESVVHTARTRAVENSAKAGRMVKAADQAAETSATAPVRKEEADFSLDDLAVVDAPGTEISAPLPERKKEGPATTR